LIYISIFIRPFSFVVIITLKDVNHYTQQKEIKRKEG